jgi:penicillin-binding protein 1A
VGYTPYYTTAIWFGFDKPGNSLGVNLTGSTLAGPVWGDYMREIHQGLAPKDFVRPSTGLIDVTVCAKSGLLKTPACNEGEVTLPFLEGTQPTQYCGTHGNTSYTSFPVSSMPSDMLGLDEDILLGSLSMPALPMDLLPQSPNREESISSPNTVNRRDTPARGGSVSNRNRGRDTAGSRPSPQGRTPDRNPFLDDESDLLPPAPPVLAEGETKTPEESGSIVPEEETRPLPAAVETSLDPDYGLELPSYNPLRD